MFIVEQKFLIVPGDVEPTHKSNIFLEIQTIIILYKYFVRLNVSLIFSYEFSLYMQQKNAIKL